MSFLGTAELSPRSQRDSEDLRDDPEWVIGLLVVAWFLPFRQFDLRARQLLVGNLAQDMSEGVEPRAPLIVGVNDGPRRPRGAGGEKHLVACPRGVVPAGRGCE